MMLSLRRGLNRKNNGAVKGRMLMRLFVRIFCIIILAIVLLPFIAYAQLSINFVAINPSETETKEIEIEYFLPKELNPDDILDKIEGLLGDEE